MSHTTPANSPTVTVLVYSDDRDVRQQVILALGRRPDQRLGEFEYVEVATAPVVLEHVAAAKIDIMVLDGEAVPAGGLGLAKQIKDEFEEPAPIVVLTGREQDAWLATWSRAEVAVARPLDPVRLVEAVVGLLTVPRAAGQQ